MCQYKPSDGFTLIKQKRLIITQLTYNFKERYKKKKSTKMSVTHCIMKK